MNDHPEYPTVGVVKNLEDFMDATKIETDGFHTLWGQAKESPEYDKRAWLVFQAKLVVLGRSERSRRQTEATLQALVDTMTNAFDEGALVIEKDNETDHSGAYGAFEDAYREARVVVERNRR